MLKTWAFRLIRGWNLLRITRLLLAVGLLIGAIETVNTLFIFIGGFLLLQALFNVGCACNTCDMPIDERYKVSGEDSPVSFEEIKVAEKP